MRLKINGEWRDVDGAATVAALLQRLGIAEEAVGVMQNGVVLDRSALGGAPVQAEDELEIVRFVGGG